MRRLLANRCFMVVLVCLLLAATVVVGLIPNSPIRKLVRPIDAVISPIQRVFKGFGNKCSNFKVAIMDGMAIREENQQLKERLAELQYVNTQNEEAKLRYEELKDAFHIKDTFSMYDIFGAAILSRDADEWFSIIRAGAGSSDGIDCDEHKSLAVVDVKMNLLGRVIESNKNNCKILPLLHEGFAVSAKVNEVNGEIVTVKGDNAYKNKNLCLVTDICENADLKLGTEIVTSGEGGLFPQGVPIGTIESVDNSNPQKITATLKPFTHIDSLKDVFVMVPNEEVELSDDIDENDKNNKDSQNNKQEKSNKTQNSSKNE